DSLRRGLPRLLAPLVDGQFLVQPGDHLANAGLGKALGADRMILLQPLQALFEHAEFVPRLLVFRRVGNHSTTSTSPLRRPSASRVRPKKSTHSSQSVPSSAAKSSSGRRVNSISSTSRAAGTPRSACSGKLGGRRRTASTSFGSAFAVMKLPSISSRRPPMVRANSIQRRSRRPNRLRGAGQVRRLVRPFAL